MTDDLIGVDQKISAKVKTAVRSGIESRFGVMGFAQVTPFGVHFSL